MIGYIEWVLQEIEETRRLMAQYEKARDYEKLFLASKRLEELIYQMNHCGDEK